MAFIRKPKLPDIEPRTQPKFYNIALYLLISTSPDTFFLLVEQSYFVIIRKNMSGTSVTKPQLELKRVKPALREFYQIYNTERLSNLDYIISSYIGKEVLLLEELKKRYNVDFEPFNILLDEYRAATAPTVNGVVDKTSEDSCDRSTVKSVASAVSVASLSPAPPAAQRLKLDSRNSINLGLSNIPTIEKLMSGWKGFTLEGVPDARKEDPTAAKVNEATVMDKHNFSFFLSLFIIFADEIV